MFDKYRGALDIQKILKEEYQYEFDGNLQDFYQQPFVSLEGDGVTALFWISCQNEDYLFKPLDNPSFNIWGELLSCEFAKMLQIPCAEYRAAFFGEKYGVLSKRMENPQDTLVLGCEIFQEFLNDHQKKQKETPLLTDEKFLSLYQIPSEFHQYDAYQQKRYLFNHLNNLIQVNSILKQRGDLKKIELDNVALNLEKMLLFDIFTLQMDRHPNNWGLTKTLDGMYPSPMFDNSTSFGLGYPNLQSHANLLQSEIMNATLLGDDQRVKSIIYQNSPNFTLSPNNIVDRKERKKDIGPKVLKDYLEWKGIEGYELVEQFFEVMTEENLDFAIEHAEYINGMKMDETVNCYIHNCFCQNIKNLQDTLKQYQKGSVNNVK